MTETGQMMRNLLTKFKLHPDELYNDFDIDTLHMMVSGCLMLNGMLRCEMEILRSVHVKAIAMDDLKMVDANMKVIQGTIRLKELHLENFCLN